MCSPRWRALTATDGTWRDSDRAGLYPGIRPRRCRRLDRAARLRCRADFEAFADSPSGVALIGDDGQFWRANAALARNARPLAGQARACTWGDVSQASRATSTQTCRRVAPDGTERRLTVPLAGARRGDDARPLRGRHGRARDRPARSGRGERLRCRDHHRPRRPRRVPQRCGRADVRRRLRGRRRPLGRRDCSCTRTTARSPQEWARRLAVGDAVSGELVTRLQRADGSVFDGELGVFAVRDGDTLLGMGCIVARRQRPADPGRGGRGSARRRRLRGRGHHRHRRGRRRPLLQPVGRAPLRLQRRRR